MSPISKQEPIAVPSPDGTAFPSLTLSHGEQGTRTWKEVIMRGHRQAEPRLDWGRLRQAIQQAYTAVAQDPGRGYHFHTGRPLASLLGYHEDWLEGLPEG